MIRWVWYDYRRIWFRCSLGLEAWYVNYLQFVSFQMDEENLYFWMEPKMKTEKLALEEQIGALLRKYGKTISVAESCTGGLISHRITNVPGSSDYYDRGVISYSNQSKMDILHVSPETLRKFGAVSRQTAKEMAQGIKRISRTDLGLAASGIAGPGGGSLEKPVGLVYVCLATDEDVVCNEFRFKGGREEIKFQTSQAALEMIKEYFQAMPEKRKTQG